MSDSEVKMTDYDRVVDVFESVIRNKYALPDGLVKQWFVMACSDYELDIAPINFNEETKMFDKITNAAVTTIGTIMARYYCQREQSRINKLNNVIGRDIELNATGDAKRAVQAEIDTISRDIEQRLHKQKQHAYN